MRGVVLTPYERGAAFERRIQDEYEAKGYVVAKCGGSKGSFDLLAVRAGTGPLLIQCKYGIGGKWAGFGPAARQTLKDDARRAGGIPLLVRGWPGSGGQPGRVVKAYSNTWPA